MRIQLRQANDEGRTVWITDVRYFEPLPGCCQFTATGLNGGDVSVIHVEPNGDFLYDGETYDFCQVIS